MKVLIGIATYNRPDKLKRLIDSILKQTYTNYRIMIMFDNNDHTSMRTILSHYRDIPLLAEVNSKQCFVIGSWNHIHTTPGFDAHLTLCDDVELLPDCLEKAVGALQYNFSDSDGVVGITQLYPGREGVAFQPTGQVLVGRKFLDRYKAVNYQLCCPNYRQWYQDEELFDYSAGISKFILAYDAQLIHHHPSFYPAELDATHSLVRGNSVQQGDKDVYLRRKQHNLTWGKSWRLV